MDKASDFESEDCGFDPHRGQVLCIIVIYMKQWNLRSVNMPIITNTNKSSSLRVGFEPTREDPIWFRVKRLNHSAIAAYKTNDVWNEKCPPIVNK